MTMIAEPPTSTFFDVVDDEVTLLVPTLSESDAFGTSDHIGFSIRCRIAPDVEKTSWVVTAHVIAQAISSEVERLRDQISSLTGLTRQEIARAIGVDRRSLSGFVTGEIRPTEGRIAALRTLAETVDWSALQFGEHAREVLRGQNPDSSPLNLIAEGRTDIRRELKAAAQQAGLVIATPVSMHQRQTREPLYVKALAEWTDKGSLPTRAGVPRDDAEYEQDLSKAATALSPETRPRRRKI
jgi:transcriptional regulator with XRE-family HTH domain